MTFRLFEPKQAGRPPLAIDAAANGLAIDRQDHLYVACDSGIRVFDRSGRELAQWAASQPCLSAAVYSDGQVFAGQAGQVEIFHSTGKPIRAWRDGDRLGEVTAIAFVRGGVVVADSRARCLRRYDRLLAHRQDIGHDNRTRGFLIPNGRLDFDLDAAGVIHACNPGKHRVERYGLDGALLGHIGRFDGLDPEGFPGCCNPTNVAVDRQGRVYVTEKAGPRAKVLSAEGKLLSVISTDFDPVVKNMDIAVDSKGRIYVADPARKQVLVFEEAA